MYPKLNLSRETMLDLYRAKKNCLADAIKSIEQHNLGTAQSLLETAGNLCAILRGSGCDNFWQDQESDLIFRETASDSAPKAQ